MALLQWCTVSPQGPSSLAAIRFTAPIRVSSIRIFPKGAQPFEQCPDVVASTEPDAFFLDVFFNAHPIHPNSLADSKDKQRAPNALVPTVIAYAGGQVDFTVDMGTEYATRLMIVKGRFEALSMAIYGEIVSETLPTQTYEPKTFGSLEPVPLSRNIDPSSSSHPIQLAEQLLALIPDSPPLSVVVRLMFCLKPSDDDWDHPDFPYLYADIGEEDESFDLEGIVQATGRPIRDDTSEEVLSAFVNKIVDLIGPKDNDQSYYIAKLLSITAPQHPHIAQALLRHLDLASIFDEQTLEEATVLCLLDAVSNVDIAHHFSNDENLLSMLQGVQNSPRADKHTQSVVRRLLSRLRGWQSFEDALSNTRGNFAQCASMLKDIGTDDQSLGIWLECMMIHEDIVTKLGENPVLPNTQSHPPFLFRNPMPAVSHDEFIVFVRAFIGLSSVLAVWAWADSIGHDLCRERTLAILNLWQGVDGYREILNHLLLLRQLTRRLGWITTDNDPPRKSGILAERILSTLANDPHAVLLDDVITAILNLEPPLAFIAENERLAMRKIAFVAEDGLPAAVEELAFSSDRPFSLRRLRTLRVSLAIVERELAEPKGEWRVLQIFWDEHNHGLVPRLVDILFDIVDDLNQHFAIQPVPRMNQTLSDQLFRTADDILRLILRLSSAIPLPNRALRNLTISVADLFACTDAADMIFSQSSSACMSAQGGRQTCLDLMRSLSGPTNYVESGTLSAQVILRTLLDHAGHSAKRDPAYHLSQVFSLMDHILPDPINELDNNEQSHWVALVLPTVLPELRTFFRLLDSENRAHLVRRLVNLDEGVTGVGEWLLQEELKAVLQTLQTLPNSTFDEEYRLVLRYQVSNSIQLFLEIASPPSSLSTWFRTSLSSNGTFSHLLHSYLSLLFDHRFSSLPLTKLIHVLAKNANDFEPDFQITILLSLLRSAQIDPTAPYAVDAVVDILKELSSHPVACEELTVELGTLFSTCADNTSTLEAEKAEILLQILEWLLQQENSRLTTLRGITIEAFTRLCDHLGTVLPGREDVVEDVQLRMIIDEDEVFASPMVELPDGLALSLDAIERLLQMRDLIPSTPKGTKTPDILGVVISPPTALLRSPAATGLTKTYANNDFRQLRQVPSARLNTSRLPSMHVDDFETNPELLGADMLPVIPNM